MIIEESNFQTKKPIYQDITHLIRPLSAKTSPTCPQCHSTQIKTTPTSHPSHKNRICLTCTQRFNLTC